MSKMLRVVGLVILAVSTAAAPCTPALAYSAACQMPPCEQGSAAGIAGSPVCCCAAPGSTSERGQTSASSISATRAVLPDPEGPGAPAPQVGFHPDEAALTPASCLYIHHPSLLM